MLNKPNSKNAQVNLFTTEKYQKAYIYTKSPQDQWNSSYSTWKLQKTPRSKLGTPLEDVSLFPQVKESMEKKNMRYPTSAMKPNLVLGCKNPTFWLFASNLYFKLSSRERFSINFFILIYGKWISLEKKMLHFLLSWQRTLIHGKKKGSHFPYSLFFMARK